MDATKQAKIDEIMAADNGYTYLAKATQAAHLVYPGTVAMANQMALMQGRGNIEKGLKAMIEGVELYCKGASKGWDAPIGKDYVLAPEIGAIINGLLGLLNGPGRFDGGSCDHALRAIAKKYEIEDVEQ